MACPKRAGIKGKRVFLIADDVAIADLISRTTRHARFATRDAEQIIALLALDSAFTLFSTPRPCQRRCQNHILPTLQKMLWRFLDLR